MPYVNKARPYKKEYSQQKSRGEGTARLERQRARAAFDKKYGKENRAGKDIGHKKALARGGSNKDGYRLEDRSKNRAKGGGLSKPPKKKSGR
jgi:hypothetical protein